MIEAEKNRDQVRAEIKGHAKLCGRCSAAIRLERYASACDLGWLLLKDERRLDVALDRVVAVSSLQLPGQLALF